MTARSGTRPIAVETRGLGFSYGAHPALDNVTTTIHEGDFVSIVGPNGGGKTTLLKLIVGLLAPNSGEIRVFGTSPVKARRRVGSMPQHAHLDPQFPVTVSDVVLMGRHGRRRIIGPSSRRDHEIALGAMAETRVDHLRDRPFSNLSGGQRQRVLIARALATEPDMLLLDEPTASLDPRVQDELYDLLHRLNERMTVVLVSHDVGVVSQHVDRVLCVNITLDEHDTTKLAGELTKLYAGGSLVRHDHHHHPEDGEQ